MQFQGGTIKLWPGANSIKEPSESEVGNGISVSRTLRLRHLLQDPILLTTYHQSARYASHLAYPLPSSFLITCSIHVE